MSLSSQLTRNPPARRPIRGTLFDCLRKKFSKSPRRPMRGTLLDSLIKNPGDSLPIA